jgi:hypothetical protein
VRFFQKKAAKPVRGLHALAQFKASMEMRQRQFAGYLGRKTQYWNRASKLTALLLFVAVFGGCCLLLILKAIIHF